jgi:hypothetical protein
LSLQALPRITIVNNTPKSVSYLGMQAIIYRDRGFIARRCMR